MKRRGATNNSTDNIPYMTAFMMFIMVKSTNKALFVISLAVALTVAFICLICIEAMLIGAVSSGCVPSFFKDLIEIKFN